jgi:hypothetical protein
VAQDHLLEVHAAAVVAVGRGGGHAPERLGHELRDPRRARGVDIVVLAFVEAGTQVVALEVGEDVLHHEGLPGRQELGVLQTVDGIDVAIGEHLDAHRGAREEAIEDPVDGIVHGLYVRHAAVALERQVLHVTLRAADLLHQGQTLPATRRLPAATGLEVVEQVELQVVHHGGVDLVHDSVAVGIGIAARADGRSLERVLGRVEDEAGRARHALDRSGLGQGAKAGIVGRQAHLGLEGADDELPDRDRPPVVKEGPHAQIGIHTLDAGGIQRPVGSRGDDSVGHPLARQGVGCRGSAGARLLEGQVPDGAQIASDLVGELLHQAQTEQVR